MRSGKKDGKRVKKKKKSKERSKDKEKRIRIWYGGSFCESPVCIPRCRQQPREFIARGKERRGTSTVANELTRRSRRKKVSKKQNKPEETRTLKSTMYFANIYY